MGASVPQEARAGGHIMTGAIGRMLLGGCHWEDAVGGILPISVMTVTYQFN